jgi:acyl-CoA synthetase (AMP-forming)/AMP-acid ligase II
VNVAGRKVQPEEVEQVLRLMPQVAEAHVLGVADARRGEMLVACLVPRGVAPTIFQVRQHCSRYLSPHKVPRWVVVLETMPVTDRGKRDHRRLRELAEASVAGQEERM